MKLFDFDFAPGFMQVAIVDEDMHLYLKRPALGPLPASADWQTFRANWWHRSGRRRSVPGISRSHETLCIRCDALPLLGLDVKAQVEPLPFTVEGQPWCLLRPLHRLSGIDAATSVPYEVPGVASARPVLLLRYLWLNAIDPHAERAMIFDTLPEGGKAWVTEEFVRRVKAAGLEGLRFVHSGYLVRDLAHAVPDPSPEKRFPWTKPVAPKPPPPAARVSDLDANRLAALDAARALAARLLPAATSALADECIELLDRWMHEGRRRWKRLDPSARAECIAAAAAAFGDLVCRELGWHWATLRRGDEGPWLAIANAEKTCALLIEQFAQRQFTSEDRTLRLQFNMLRAGQLPAPPAEGAAVIG